MCIRLLIVLVLPLWIVDPRRTCAAGVTIVGSVCLCVSVSVCVSVQHLTSRAYFRPENHMTYSTGNEGQKNCGVFPETASLQRFSIPSVVRPACSAKVRTVVYRLFSV